MGWTPRSFRASISAAISRWAATAEAHGPRTTSLPTPDAHSLKLGKHSLRFAGQFQRQQVNTFQPSAPAGSYYFGTGYTDLPGITGTGSEFASFLLGGVESGEVTDVTSPSYFRSSRFVLSASDTWEPISGLTISFAATSETSSPRVEKYNRQSTVDLHAINPENGLPGAEIFAGLNGAPTTFQPYISTVDSSISLAWSPGGNRKSVVRANYARSYQAPPLYGSQWGTQGFNATQTFNAQNTETTPAFFLAQGVPAGTPAARPQGHHRQWQRTRRCSKEPARRRSTSRGAFPTSARCRCR